MAVKTVLKMILSKFGPLEIESQISRAISADQSVQKVEGDYQYIDNDNGIDIEAIDVDKERQRIVDHIAKSKTEDELKKVAALVEEYELTEEYDNRSLVISQGNV